MNEANIEKPLLEQDETNWQKTVQHELNELTGKLVKLRYFITTPTFRNLSHKHCRLLIDQSHLMMQYADVLSARLDEDLRNSKITPVGDRQSS